MLKEEKVTNHDLKESWVKEVEKHHELFHGGDLGWEFPFHGGKYP